MRIAILSRNPSLYSTRALVEAAEARGHEVRVLDTLQFDIRVSRRNPELFYQGEPVGPVDAVIPRIGASITDPAARVVSASTTPIPCVPCNSFTTTGGPSTFSMHAGTWSAWRV